MRRASAWALPVAALHSGKAKRWLGVLNYPRVLYLAWRRMRAFAVEIVCDGEQHDGAFVHLLRSTVVSTVAGWSLGLRAPSPMRSSTSMGCGVSP